MATNLQIISDALRLINVISEIDTPTAEQSQHALRVMNRMIESWNDDDIELGWFEQDNAGDEFPLPLSLEEPVTSLLATKLAATYGATISQELGVYASNAQTTMVRKALLDKLAESDMSNLPAGAAGRVSTSILTDE